MCTNPVSHRAILHLREEGLREFGISFKREELIKIQIKGGTLKFKRKRAEQYFWPTVMKLSLYLNIFVWHPK